MQFPFVMLWPNKWRIIKTNLQLTQSILSTSLLAVNTVGGLQVFEKDAIWYFNHIPTQNIRQAREECEWYWCKLVYFTGIWFPVLVQQKSVHKMSHIPEILIIGHMSRSFANHKFWYTYWFRDFIRILCH